MRGRFVQAGSTFVVLALAGCPFGSKSKPEPPIALAKLPTMAYPVVLPPPEPVPPAPEPVATDAPPSMPPPKVTKPRPKPRSPRVVTEKPSTSPEAAQSSPVPSQKVVISPGGGSPPPSNPGISAGMAHTNEAHQSESTAELLQSTEDNLRMLNRQLSTEERGVLDQIRNFMAQSRAASADGDLVRAHNLALKAHLLSDELARP